LRNNKRLAELPNELAEEPATRRAIEAKEELRRTMKALQALSVTDRAALLMRAEDDLSYEEIARALGISVSSAKVKVHRARLRLAMARSGETAGGRN
jgi:RNA polymerase sigma-70 factor (ECF subfamily)